MTGFSAGQLELAQQLGAATLHEAAGRTGAFPAAIKPVSPAMRLAGPAFTVHVPAGDNLWIHRALYVASPGDVLVVSTSGGFEWGYWGDILNEAAIAQRLAGLVIDGGVRDTAGLEQANFLVFSREVCIRGTIKGLDAIAHVKQPIRIGDVVIRHGDLIMGDRDGVVAIRAEDVPAVLEKGVARTKDENEKIERIREGARTIDLYAFGA